MSFVSTQKMETSSPCAFAFWMRTEYIRPSISRAIRNCPHPVATPRPTGLLCTAIPGAFCAKSRFSMFSVRWNFFTIRRTIFGELYELLDSLYLIPSRKNSFHLALVSSHSFFCIMRFLSLNIASISSATSSSGSFL